MFLLMICLGGGGCTAYDVVVNKNFYQRIKKQDALMGFFLTVVLEGLESKYDISLDRSESSINIASD